MKPHPFFKMEHGPASRLLLLIPSQPTQGYGFLITSCCRTARKIHIYYPFLIMSAEDVGKAFVAHYYGARDSNPASLGSLYTAQSALTFEGTKVDGSAAIVAKFQSLGPVAHNVPALVVDIQPGPGGASLLIFVTGHIKIGSDGNPLQFSHVFELVMRHE